MSWQTCLGWSRGGLLVVFSLLSTGSICAQTEEIRKALAIRPNQQGVDFDVVEPEAMTRCQLVRAAEVINVPGWIVRDGGGRVLRQFLDLNQDGQLDQWSFFKNGIEVYRDIDSNYDRKADQFRWMGTAGIRWGVDRDQDGNIDFWNTISAEEVAAEVFAAVKERDRARFLRLLPTPDELKSIECGEDWYKQLAGSLQRASNEFERFAAQQQAVVASSQFIHFGSSRPCLIPAGATGNANDLVFHDHAAAVFQTGEAYDQLAVGTLLRIGDAYRVLELPAVIAAGEPLANGGLFFQSLDDAAVAVGIPNSGMSSAEVVDLYSQIEALNEKLAGNPPANQLASLHQQRAELYWRIVEATADEDRQNWIRNAADAFAAAFQEGTFPTALETMRDFQQRLAREGQPGAGDYLAWRLLLAQFAKGMEGSAEERGAATEQYLKSLEQFTSDYANSEFAPEALMNLAMYAEVSERSDPKAAKKWYTQLVTDFADTSEGRRARGALLRLESNGKPMLLQGDLVNGSRFDVGQHRGKVVVIHYWATWCDACVEEFKEFQRLAAKYKNELVIVGANLDDSSAELEQFLKANRQVGWPQLFAPGGMESSSLAEQWGIPTLPWIVVIGPDGNAANTNAAAMELDREIQRLLED